MLEWMLDDTDGRRKIQMFDHRGCVAHARSNAFSDQKKNPLMFSWKETTPIEWIFDKDGDHFRTLKRDIHGDSLHFIACIDDSTCKLNRNRNRIFRSSPQICSMRHQIWKLPSNGPKLLSEIFTKHCFAMSLFESVLARKIRKSKKNIHKYYATCDGYKFNCTCNQIVL